MRPGERYRLERNWYRRECQAQQARSAQLQQLVDSLQLQLEEAKAAQAAAQAVAPDPAQAAAQAVAQAAAQPPPAMPPPPPRDPAFLPRRAPSPIPPHPPLPGAHAQRPPRLHPRQPLLPGLPAHLGPLRPLGAPPEALSAPPGIRLEGPPALLPHVQVLTHSLS